jgi:hypothetical protein
MLTRIIGVFKLDVATFEEIEHNESLTLWAALVVGVVAVISGFGNAFFNLIVNKSFIGGFFGAIFSTILGWIAWSLVTWFVGTRFFNGQADLGEMLRVIGFAYAPLVLSIIPCIGGVVGAVWAIIAGFIAIRQGLDLDNTKTLYTVVVGVVVYFILTLIVNLIF